MTQSAGRRERKKAATRQHIADTAHRLFLERGYDAVGIRDIAAEADVAVTTLFAHFGSKEALVFEQDAAFEQALASAVGDRDPGTPLMPALRRQVHDLVRHCTGDDAAPIWRMVDESPALRDFEETMRLRHARTLAAAVAADVGLRDVTTQCSALARFVVDAYSLARTSADPHGTVDDVFEMIDAAWVAVRPPG